jgi:hypothetical protein
MNMGLVPDDHDPQGEGHYVEVRLDFYATDDAERDDEGLPKLNLGSVQVHSHHVPDNLYVETLLIMARDCVAKSMAQNMFREEVPEPVRMMAASMMASQYLKQRLEDPTFGAEETINALVPDDISSLLDDDGNPK